MIPTEKLRELVELARKAPIKSGEICHSGHITETKDDVLDSISESIQKSIDHDGGHPWWWMQTYDGRKVAEFGCGPSSERSARFYGACDPTVIQALCDELLAAREALEFYADPMHWKVGKHLYFKCANTLVDGDTSPDNFSIIDGAADYRCGKRARLALGRKA